MPTPHFLHSIFQSDSFTEQELSLIVDQFELIEFSKNDNLIEKGSIADYYYFLESGFCRAHVLDIDGNDVTTIFFTPKAIVINWDSFFLKKPSKESIQAVTHVKGWKITFERFMKLFNIEAFREVGRTKLVMNYFDLKNHSLSVITDSAKERYLNLMKEHPDLIQNVPLKHIATYLGIKDTSLSRIRAEITL